MRPARLPAVGVGGAGRPTGVKATSTAAAPAKPAASATTGAQAKASGAAPVATKFTAPAVPAAKTAALTGDKKVVADQFAAEVNRLVGTKEIAALRSTAGKNLGAVMNCLLEAEGALQGPKAYFVGDVEGREQNNLRTLVEQGVLGETKDGKLQFKDPKASLVMLGDLADRGPATIRTLTQLTELKRANPDRVTFIYGNRDLAKLGLLNDLGGLEKLESKEYRDWLAAKAGDGAKPGAVAALNTIENRVQFWLEGHSARQELDFHREELSLLAGRPVSAREAAEDYVTQLKPGGLFFEFLKLGQFGTTGDDFAAWHGGASSAAIKQVPGEMRPVRGAKDWAGRYVSLGKKLIAETEQRLLKGEKVPSMLLQLGDSSWDSRTQFNDWNGQSVIYGMREKDGDNYRSFNADVEQFYRKDGIAVEIVGHSPIGDLPTPAVASGGGARIYGDTSFSFNGSQAMLVSSGDLKVMAGRVGDAETGEVVVWTLKPGASSPLGHVTSDGFLVAGMTLDGNYYLTSYAEGHKLASKKVSPQELANLDPRSADVAESSEAMDGVPQWKKAIDETPGITRLPDLAALEELRLGDDPAHPKRPIVISGASAYGKIPGTEEQISQLWSSLLGAVKPEESMLLTGGTDVQNADGSKAPEFLLHEQATAKAAVDRTLVGVVPLKASADTLDKTPKNLVVVGDPGEWDAPLQSSLAFAAEHGGAVIFVGGGGAVTRAIEQTRTDPSLKDLQVFLIAGDARTPSPKGASDLAARTLLASSRGTLPRNVHVITADQASTLGPAMRKALALDEA